MTLSTKSKTNWPNGLDPNEPVVKPIVGRKSPRLGPRVLMVSSRGDMGLVDDILGVDARQYRPLFMSRLYPDPSGVTGFSITGPVVGAPYAVMLLETLAAWGARNIVFLGWCGAVAPDVAIGDVILPSGAFVDEGTSRHYGAGLGGLAEASPSMNRHLARGLSEADIRFHEGPVWSTDGIYRETPEKIRHFHQKGALAVEMEVSALFTVGRHLRVDVGALLVVSDALSGFAWRPGFKDERFLRSRGRLCQAAGELCQSR